MPKPEGTPFEPLPDPITGEAPSAAPEALAPEILPRAARDEGGIVPPAYDSLGTALQQHGVAEDVGDPSADAAWRQLHSGDF